MSEVAIIGMGTMGHAIETQLQNEADTTVRGIHHGDDLNVIESADVAIIAVKPQSFTGEFAAEIGSHLDDHHMVISIMAGITVRRLREELGTDHVVRTMPNLALRTGQSVTAWYTEDESVDEAHIETLLSTWGKSIRLQNEEQFNAFTALAGSGPAYFYLLAAMLEDLARQQGFTNEQAKIIGSHVLIGAASVITEDVAPSELVKRVASKGGTTEAALATFERKGFWKTIRAGVAAAIQRSRELGGQRKRR